MNNVIIEKLQLLNEEFISQYLATSHETTKGTIDTSTEVRLLAKDNPKYDFKYFDLMTINVLMFRHRGVVCTLTPNMSELISRMAYDACLAMNIFPMDRQAKEFCEDLAFHRVPDEMLVYQFLLWIERYNENIYPVWFPYVMLLFAFTNTKQYINHPYRSRYIVGVINNFIVLKLSGEHEHEVRYDEFKMVQKTKQCLKCVLFDKRYVGVEFTGYMLDSLRLLAICYLSAIVYRGCTWPVFKLVGDEVLGQHLRQHQNIVNKHYNAHKATGVL